MSFETTRFRSELSAPELRRYSSTSPLVVTWIDEEGFHAIIGLREPSLREDIIKIITVNLINGTVSGIKLREGEDHSLSDGKNKYVVYSPNEREYQTSMDRLRMFGIDPRILVGATE